MSESPSFAIRPAVLGDAGAIFALIKAHPDELISRPLADIVQNIDRFTVCESGGRVAGCAAWSILPEAGEPERASVEIQSVAVAAHLRGRGVGRALVTRVLERIRPLHAPQALVLTFAPDFFARLGFRVVPKTQFMHKIYMGCMNCTKHANPFTCPEVAMALDLRDRGQA